MADTKSAKTDKVSPVKYLGQVRQEGRKVVWPTWRETMTTTILVMVMVLIMGLFFFVVDWFIGIILDLVFSFFDVTFGGPTNGS
jgi:preprotein translocase subunit SecE